MRTLLLCLASLAFVACADLTGPTLTPDAAVTAVRGDDGAWICILYADGSEHCWREGEEPPCPPDAEDCRDA